MYDIGLAERIRRKGVEVVEIAGWETRGSSTYSPLLGLWHHTAGPRTGSTPSLATCIYGRPDLPGPLCQVLQSREPDGRDKAYVIAAGRANHTGVGEWRGISGNSKAFGVEVEHVGTVTQPGARHEITARIIAAGLEGGSRDARNCCRHAEYAKPEGRKIDFAVVAAPWTATGMRSRVHYWIGRDFIPTPPPSLEDDQMVIIRNKDNRRAMVAYGGQLMSLTGETNVAEAVKADIPVWVVDQPTWDRFEDSFGPILA